MLADKLGLFAWAEMPVCMLSALRGPPPPHMYALCLCGLPLDAAWHAHNHHHANFKAAFILNGCVLHPCMQVPHGLHEVCQLPS